MFHFGMLETIQYRLAQSAAQPAKARQSCSASNYYYYYAGNQESNTYSLFLCR
jgi:hypothetical protein